MGLGRNSLIDLSFYLSSNKHFFPNTCVHTQEEFSGIIASNSFPQVISLPEDHFFRIVVSHSKTQANNVGIILSRPENNDDKVT